MNENNFFHRIGDWFAGSKHAERAFFNGRAELLGSKGAVYLDTDVPYKLLNSIPELFQVLTKGGNMFSNGCFKLIDIKTGKEIEDKELMELLENPNILESQNQFMHTYWMQYFSYGNQFQYKNKPTSLLKYPKSIMNISPAYMKPILTGKVWDQTDLKGIIEKYEYTENGKQRSFDTYDIIWSKYSDLDNPLIGCSPLKSIRFPLTNTNLAYDYLNIISGDKGAIGALSNSAKDMGGVIPMTEEERLRIENMYRKQYGVGDDKAGRIIVTNGTLTWQPMTYPTKDLLLLEQIDANKLTICDHFGMNINLFSSKSQTFENVRNAIIQVYQDTIIPFADQWTQKLGKELGVKEGLRLTLDYSHLAILSDKFDNLSQITTALNQAVQGGLLEREQAEQILANQIGIEVPTENKNNTLNKLNALSPIVATKVMEAFTINQALELVGLPAVTGGDKLIGELGAVPKPVA